MAPAPVTPTRDTRIPAFLNSTRADIQAKFIDLEWAQRHRLAHSAQRPAPGSVPSPWAIATTPSMAARVRYSNITPWKNNRMSLYVPDGMDDYINASPIVLKSGAAGGRTKERRWIATQGPKDPTYSHLYRLIQHETGPASTPATIIMLTQTHEADREKCFQYYPLDTSKPILRVRDAGEIGDGWRARIVLESVEFDPVCRSEVRRMRMEVLAPRTDVSAESKMKRNAAAGSEEAEGESEEMSDADSDAETEIEADHPPEEEDDDTDAPIILTKAIHHYLFSGWPDFGVPEEEEDRAALVELVRTSRAPPASPEHDSARPHPDAPPIIHCSAGVGRTGTFIALDFLLQELEAGAFDHPSFFPVLAQQKHEPAAQSQALGQVLGTKAATKEEEKDPIADVVDLLRQQRMMMVQGEGQFVFLYELLKKLWIARTGGGEVDWK